MAERNEKVLERVRQELTKNPSLGSKDLHEIAKGMDGSVGEQKLQQFHARYVLPIKREQSGGAKGGRKGGRRSTGAAKGRKPATRAAAAAKPGPQAKSGGRAKAAAPETDRNRVRSVFLDFAREFADAESRAEIVQVMSRVDDYVEKVVARGG
jgi:hypothetical protein